MAKVHEVKSEVDYFQDLWLGRRHFEIRKNDREYSIGDRVTFKEYDRANGTFTGRSVHRTVSSILLADDRVGLMPGYVGLGLADGPR